MSVRAYRVIEIKTEEFESFNPLKDYTLNDELKKSGYYNSLNEGVWIFEISVSDLKEIIADIGSTITPDTLKNLQEDIKATEAIGEEYIQYYCY